MITMLNTLATARVKFKNNLSQFVTIFNNTI